MRVVYIGQGLTGWGIEHGELCENVSQMADARGIVHRGQPFLVASLGLL